jgi:hypothetical protein
MRKFLDRLFPTRLRQRKELARPERLQLWRSVTDGDLCLRATLDLLDDCFQHSAELALNPTTEARVAEIYRLRAGLMLELMKQIETERDQAKALT